MQQVLILSWRRTNFRNKKCLSIRMVWSTWQTAKIIFPPFDAFHGKFRSCNPPETQYTDYVNLVNIGLTTAQVVTKLKLSEPPPTGIGNYQHLQQLWKQEQMNSIKSFSLWYNRKEVVPTLEAVQKMIASIAPKISIS